MKRLKLSLQDTVMLELLSNSISSSDKLAVGLVQSDRSSHVNNLSESIEDSANSPALWLVLLCVRYLTLNWIYLVFFDEKYYCFMIYLL